MTDPFANLTPVIGVISYPPLAPIHLGPLGRHDPADEMAVAAVVTPVRTRM